jgi:hypothetical protein
LSGEIDEGDTLARFFGLMTKFNKGKDFKVELKKKIEAYFAYRWQYDKLQALDGEDEQALLDQVPEHVKDFLFSQFVFTEFIHTFASFFQIEKGKTMVRHDDHNEKNG